MGLKFLVIGVSSLALGGCLATGGKVRTIDSNPPGATVTIDGYGECTTPCKVKLDQRRNVTIGKPGFKAQRFAISPDGPTVKVNLELVAKTSDVNSSTLPDID